MSFTRYVCWRPERVHVVMNPDAEHVDEAVFLAVHSEYPLPMVHHDPSVVWAGGRRSTGTITPHDFVAQFLSDTRRHVQVAVLGESGSGKSHFIHWLRLQIPDDPSARYVLSIPKTGTSLRGVLQHIIEVLPREQQRKYRERLDEAGSHLATDELRRHRLLVELELAIRADTAQTDDVETEEWLLEHLPGIFADPFLRKKYVTDDQGIVGELVAHVITPLHSRERSEEPRLFQAADLPLSGRDGDQMAPSIKEFVRILIGMQDQFVPLALQIINRNLERAIVQMLNFTGDQLLQLMTEIRQYLRREDKELVLLIEDFAQIQGVAGALLQALIESPGTGEDALCNLRWAMAVTRGYYEKLPRTVQTRMTMVLDMDLPRRGERAIVDDKDVVAFSSRYLNAARLSEEALQQWYEGRRSGKNTASPPNACDSCPYQDECHATFHDADGHGLYPFTPRAVLNMARRRDPQLDERFNPRSLIKDVLADVLDIYREDVRMGRFPSESLLARFGGSRLPPAVDEQLQEQASDEEVYRRQRAALELWGEEGRLVELPAGLYRAFDLPPPDIAVERPETSTSPEAGPRTAERSAVDLRIQAVRDWGRGQPLKEGVAAVLRDRVYQALESYTDWDAGGLERAWFARRDGGPFRAAGISFRRQETLPRRYPITLELPLRDDPAALRQAAITLEGLLQFERHGNWRFENGHQCLVALGECLAEWSAALVAQCGRLADGEGKWDPVATATQLLALGAALGGKTSADDRLSELENALFDSWPEQAPAQSPEWQRLYRAVYQRRDTLRAIVRAQASGGKGGRVGGLLDARQLRQALFALRDKNWTPTAKPPAGVEDRRNDYAALAVLYRQVEEQLSRAAAAEYERKANWLAQVRQHIPAGTPRLKVVEALEHLRDAVSAEGISCRAGTRHALDEALEAFKSGYVDNAIQVIESLQSDENRANPLRLLPQLARDRIQPAMAATERFLPAAAQFVTEVSDSVAFERQTLQAAGADDLERVQRDIEESLAQWASALEQLEQHGAHSK